LATSEALRVDRVRYREKAKLFLKERKVDGGEYMCIYIYMFIQKESCMTVRRGTSSSGVIACISAHNKALTTALGTLR